MKFWFDSDGKSTGGKKFFARMQEVMVDKNGKPVYAPAPTPAPATVDEPAPEVTTAEATEPVAVESAPVAPVIVAVPEEDHSHDEITAKLEDYGKRIIALETKTETIDGKCDIIIEKLVEIKTVEPAPVAVEEPAPEEVTEEVEEAVEDVAEVVDEPVTEEVTEEVEEPATEEVTEEVAATEVINITIDKEITDMFVSYIDTEEPAPEVDTAVAEAKTTAPRSRSFAEKMRDASEILQDRYDELKNYALRFRKLKSRISRKFDSINQGRFQFVKLGLAGKTLKLYLNMDVSTTDPKFHCKDMSDKKTYVTVPTMLRIKSGRAVKYAKILIDQCAEQHGMLERRKPFVVDAMALIEEALAAKNLPTETPDEDGDAE